MGDSELRTVSVELPLTTDDVDLGFDRRALKRALAEDSDDDDDDADAIEVKKEPNVSQPPLKRAHIEFPEIRSEYLKDKVAAVREAVEPYHRSKVDAQRDRINAIAEHAEHKRKQADRMFDNPAYVFTQLVRGHVRDDTVLADQISFNPNSGAAAGRLAQAPISVVAGTGAESVGGPLRSLLPETPGLDAAAEQERVLHNSRAAVAKPSISGVGQMSPLLVTGVEEALATLVSSDPTNPDYAMAAAEHFYADRHAMRLFAGLVAAHIKLIKVTAPKQFYKDKDEFRRGREISTRIRRMKLQLHWDRAKNSFVQSTGADYNRNLDKEYGLDIYAMW